MRTQTDRHADRNTLLPYRVIAIRYFNCHQRTTMAGNTYYTALSAKRGGGLFLLNGVSIEHSRD